MPYEVIIANQIIRNRNDYSDASEQTTITSINALDMAKTLVENLQYTVTLHRNNVNEVLEYLENLQSLLKIAQKEGILSEQDELFFKKLYNKCIENSYDDSGLDTEKFVSLSYNNERIRYKDLLEKLYNIVSPRMTGVVDCIDEEPKPSSHATPKTLTPFQFNLPTSNTFTETSGKGTKRKERDAKLDSVHDENSKRLKPDKVDKENVPQATPQQTPAQVLAASPQSMQSAAQSLPSLRSPAQQSSPARSLASSSSANSTVPSFFAKKRPTAEFTEHARLGRTPDGTTLAEPPVIPDHMIPKNANVITYKLLKTAATSTFRFH